MTAAWGGGVIFFGALIWYTLQGRPHTQKELGNTNWTGTGGEGRKEREKEPRTARQEVGEVRL